MVTLLSPSVYAVKLGVLKGLYECPNINRYSECLESLETQLIKDTSEIYRPTEDVLVLRLKNNEQIRFKDTVNKSDEYAVQHLVHFAIALLDNEFVLLYKGFYEGSQIELISLSTGEATQVDGYPALSKDKRSLLVAQGGLDSEHTSPTFKVFDINKNKLTLAFDAKPDNWEPDHVEWLTNSKVMFTKRQNNPNYQHKTQSSRYIEEKFVLDISDTNNQTIEPADTDKDTDKDTDQHLHIHVHYQQDSDSWQVNYVLPNAVDQVAFRRPSNLDRRKLYTIDESKFKWDQEGDTLLIRSIGGKKFTSLSIEFSSYYDFIQKDYTHNIKYTDGSVLLYTNHLALGTDTTEDKLVNAEESSLEGASHTNAAFKETKFHFYGPNQNIVFLGQSFKNKAQWSLEGQGTYIYFGNIQPIEDDNMIAIVDPALPKWVWNQTQQTFPKLFDYYKSKTGQTLNFKPVVFFNYDQVDGDYSNYNGGTLDGLVQLTINGQRWHLENKEKFNRLFHFLAHEAAHFWNGLMFSFVEPNHAWMHEGGADAFANLAMMDFGLIGYEQMIERFEEAANKCFLNKNSEPLEQSAKLRRYRNYYDCGATMALASHFAVQAIDSNKTVFDIWKSIFEAKIKDRTYSQQDYFEALNHLSGSTELSSAFEMFGSQSDLNNQKEIASWFKSSKITLQLSQNYPETVLRHWGKQVIYHLMKTHCKRISFSSYYDYLTTYPIEGCDTFGQSLEIQFVNGVQIFKDGLNAYNMLKKHCEKGATVTLQNRQKVDVAKIRCLGTVQSAKPYMELKVNEVSSIH